MSSDAAAFVAWGDSRRGSVRLPVEDYYFASAVHDRKALEARASGSDDTARDIALGSVVTLVVAGLVPLAASRGMSRRSDPSPHADTAVPA